MKTLTYIFVIIALVVGISSCKDPTVGPVIVTPPVDTVRLSANDLMIDECDIDYDGPSELGLTIPEKHLFDSAKLSQLFPTRLAIDTTSGSPILRFGAVLIPNIPENERVGFPLHSIAVSFDSLRAVGSKFLLTRGEVVYIFQKYLGGNTVLRDTVAINAASMNLDKDNKAEIRIAKDPERKIIYLQLNAQARSRKFSGRKLPVKFEASVRY